MATAQQIIDKLNVLKDRLEEFEVDGKRHWLVEGDVLLNERELQKYAKQLLDYELGVVQAAPKDYLIQELGVDGTPQRVDKWPLRWTIDVASFGGNDAELTQVRDGFQKACAQWASICNVSFEFMGPAPTNALAGSDSIFVVRRLTRGGGLVADAFFPWHKGARRRVNIANGFFAPSTRFDALGVLRHEIGHILGFRHEHIRVEAQAPPRFAEGWGNAQPMGDYDPKSVMHYIFADKGNSSLTFTDLDRYHAWDAYPWPNRGPTANPYGGQAPTPGRTPPRPQIPKVPATVAGIRVSLPTEHAINLGAGGALSNDGWITSDAAHVQQAVKAFVDSGSRSLTLYLHGGLKSEKAGILIAESLFHPLRTDFETWPVFFVWETGPVESLVQAMRQATGSTLFERLYAKIRKHVIKRRRGALDEVEQDVVASAIRDEVRVENPGMLDAMLGEYDPATPADEAALLADLSSDRLIAEELMRIADAPAPTGFATDAGYANAVACLDEALVEDLRGRGAELGVGTFKVLKCAAQVLIKVVKRLIDGSHHGFHATLVEELLRKISASRLGAAVWGVMKTNAELAYGVDGGAALFLAELAKKADLSALELNVIGHSAGAIHACHLVRHVAQTWPAEFPGFKSVTFAAPACDFALMNQTIVKHAARVQDFRIYALTDHAERRAALVGAVPFIYPSSLLYLVSGIAEETVDHPLLGMARFLRERPGDETVTSVRRYLAMLSLRRPAVRYSPTHGELLFTRHGGSKGPICDPWVLSEIAAVVRPAKGAARGFVAPDVPDKFEGLAFDVARATSPGRAGLANEVVAVLGDGWTLSRAPCADPNFEEWEVSPPPDTAFSMGQAWDFAYALSEALELVVEPEFEGGFPEAQAEPFTGFGAHIPNWHHETIRLDGAWKRAPQQGASIVVGHPDTGYSRHREIYTDRLLWHRGYDLMDDDEDPEDPLNKGMAGHGTRTSGILFSGVNGNVPERPSVNVVGTAPRAKLIPFRVAKSPILLSTKKLAKAIDKAVLAGVDVISISMGGMPSRKLKRAVRRATRRGVVVVVAAGQIFPFVPWPGRYREAVTVGGHEPDGTAWSKGARGKAVDVCAPATQIWVATWPKVEPPPPGSEVMKTSWGTSYATAMTAGVVALWLEHHRAQGRLHKSEGARVAKAFHWVLANCGLERVIGKEKSKYWGHGRLDATKVLEHDIPDDFDGSSGFEAPGQDDVLDEIVALVNAYRPEATPTSREIVQAALASTLGADKAAMPSLLAARGAELLTLFASRPQELARMRGAVDAHEGTGFGAAIEPLALNEVSRSLRAHLGR